MEMLFYSPELTEIGMLFKILALIAVLTLLHWLLTLIIVNTVYGKNSGFPRELDIWRAHHIALIWTFAFLNIYLLAFLNWNLGIFGIEAFRDTDFYLRFVPEFSLALVLMILIATMKANILQAVKIDA